MLRCKWDSSGLLSSGFTALYAADESEEAGPPQAGAINGGAEENAQQDVERVSSGAAAEALTQCADSGQRHVRGASMGYLVPPELAALTAFLKVCQ